MYGIFTYIWFIFSVNVGKYISPMDPMGLVVGGSKSRHHSPALNSSKSQIRLIGINLMQCLTATKHHLHTLENLPPTQDASGKRRLIRSPY